MTLKTIEIPIKGMDCAECTQHVQKAISSLAGVESAQVFLASEKAVVKLDPTLVPLSKLQKAVADAGYSVLQPENTETTPATSDFTKRILTVFGMVFGLVLFIVVFGEWLGLFEAVTAIVPWPIGWAIVLLIGYPIFRNVIRATLRRQVIAHTLMSLGVVAALAVGEWPTAAVIAMLMRVGDYTETFTTERARRAVKELTAMSPQTARVERDGTEVEVPAAQVQVGDIVIVRPGEKIPVDGQVISGQATVNQAAITGESMPVEAAPGSSVFAATVATLGSLRIKTVHVGPDTTFGRVVKMVEEAEAHRADVQRIADKFSAYYLPVVAAIALLTFLIRRDPLATAAVLVVACSCSFALATPIAMLASVGAGAKRGILIKGGKYLEALARADVLLIDKTGTLTLGQPKLTQIVPLNGHSESEILALAASAESDSEHPLAQAVRDAAKTNAVTVPASNQFEAMPGIGVRAQVGPNTITVGSYRSVDNVALPAAAELEAQGNTLLYVSKDEELIGLLAAADTLRSEVPHAIEHMRALGIKRIELLTGDNERTAAAIATPMGIQFRANLLPEDKIRIVKEYQAQRLVVVMVGDGVNDAPALAQANVGIAMGAAGSDVAIEAAHVALMREDWQLVPDLFEIAHRTMRIVKLNIGFTIVYNVLGLSLAALGILPPILAAAAQSVPDLGILANSSRLLRFQSQHERSHTSDVSRTQVKANAVAGEHTCTDECCSPKETAVPNVKFDV